MSMAGTRSNICPQEVEEALEEHSAIEAAGLMLRQELEHLGRVVLGFLDIAGDWNQVARQNKG